MSTLRRKICQYMANMESPDHPVLGPVLRGLKFFGMMKREKEFINRAYDSLNVIGALFLVAQYAQLVPLSRRGNFDEIMENLSLTLVCTMSVIKLITIRLWYAHWCEIIEVVSATEVHQARHPAPEDAKVVRNYTKYARTITYFFWIVSVSTITMLIFKPVLEVASSSELRAAIERGEVEPKKVFSAWNPFDVTSSPMLYWSEFALQAVLGMYFSGSTAMWDTFVVSLMVFFGGQLELLRNSCGRIAAADADDAEAHERIGRCHRHHVFIVKYARLMGTMISPPMFVYFIICSIMFCATVLQMTTQARSSLQVLLTLEYFVATFIQLLLFYWHSAQVLEKSELVERGVYEAAWVGRGGRLRRELALLALGLRQPILFYAGPVIPMTIASFTAILKATYSYFALLNSKANKN